jgi:hypothetical protein
LLDAINRSNFEITGVINGKAKGVDTLASRYALENNIALEEYPVSQEEWNQYGKRAGPMRNTRMLNKSNPDAILAIWDGESTGTGDMITKGIKAGIIVRICYV